MASCAISLHIQSILPKCKRSVEPISLHYWRSCNIKNTCRIEDWSRFEFDRAYGYYKLINHLKHMKIINLKTSSADYTAIKCTLLAILKCKPGLKYLHIAGWEHLALLCVFFVGGSKPLAISRDLHLGRLHFGGIDCSSVQICGTCLNWVCPWKGMKT